MTLFKDCKKRPITRGEPKKFEGFEYTGLIILSSSFWYDDDTPREHGYRDENGLGTRLYILVEGKLSYYKGNYFLKGVA